MMKVNTAAMHQAMLCWASLPRDGHTRPLYKSVKGDLTSVGPCEQQTQNKNFITV
jgi:hypothetical protein